MKTQDYKIYILDGNGHIVLAYDFKGFDDMSALEEARKHSIKNPIEIWQQSRLVAHIDLIGRAAFG